MQPVIDSALNAFAPRGSDIVKHQARLMAADAVKSYTPTKGASLSTHVYRQLQRLQRVAPDLDDPMKLSEGLRRDRAIVGTAIQKVQDDLGREASDEEVAEIAKLPVKRVTKVRQMLHAGIPVSALDAVDEEEDGRGGHDPIVYQHTPEDDWQDAVYHDLGDIDRVIMQYRTGYRGYPVLSTNEIAQRLKVTPGLISQRARRIQERLDEFHG